MIRTMIVVGALLSYIGLTEAQGSDACSAEGAYAVIFSESMICVPLTFSLDTRYYMKAGHGVMLREIYHGKETGKTIAISFQKTSKDDLQGLKIAGYEYKQRCGYDIFVIKRGSISASVIVFIKEGFIQFSNFDEKSLEYMISTLWESRVDLGEGVAEHCDLAPSPRTPG